MKIKVVKGRLCFVNEALDSPFFCLVKDCPDIGNLHNL